MKELAEITNMNPRTLLNWKQKGLPHLDSGRFDLTAVLKWQPADTKDIEESFDDPELVESQRKYWKEKATLEKIKVDTKTGQLVNINEVNQDAWGIGNFVKIGRTTMNEQFYQISERTGSR